MWGRLRRGVGRRWRGQRRTSTQAWRVVQKIVSKFQRWPMKREKWTSSIGIRLDKGSIAEFEFMQPTSHKTKQMQTDPEGKLIVVDTSREENENRKWSFANKHRSVCFLSPSPKRMPLGNIAAAVFGLEIWRVEFWTNLAPNLSVSQAVPGASRLRTPTQRLPTCVLLKKTAFSHWSRAGLH